MAGNSENLVVKAMNQMYANPVSSAFGGQQAAQQQQSNAFAMQQNQQNAKRDDEFRNALTAYLTGGSNSLAAVYQADPERGMQVQTFQNQQNQFAAQKKVAEAKQSYAQAQGVLNSESPADYLRVLIPNAAEAWSKQSGRPSSEMTDDDALAMAQHVATTAGAAAGIVPEYTAPEAGQMGGEEVVYQVDKTTGRPRVIPGVTPRPQKPLVELNTGVKAESEANKAYGKAEGEAFSAVLQRGQDAQDKAATLRAMRENPAITGPTQDFRAAANAFFSDLGVPLSAERVGQISNLAQYKSIQNQLVLTEQLKQKGPQTESDAKRIAESFGKTNNIQAANKLILNYQLALADREGLLAEMAEEYRTRTGTIDGWRKELREYVRDTPLAGIDPQSNRLVFWNEFMDGMKEDNPGMSDDEIMAYWRKRYGGAR